LTNNIPEISNNVEKRIQNWQTIRLENLVATSLFMSGSGAIGHFESNAAPVILIEASTVTSWDLDTHKRTDYKSRED
jgi:hypothetical protein